MKILVTGANGYVGSTLCRELKNYEVTRLTRAEVDLTDQTEVDRWFQSRRFDTVIHCATSGGSRLKEDTSDVTHKNLQMFYNLLRNKHKFNKFINIGSGAEFDRYQSIAPIWIEDNKRYPIDPYGMSKSIIHRLIENLENFYTIRVFALFDENEWDTRFIKANLKRYINKQPIQVDKDRMLDFFYMEDFLKVVEYYLTENRPPKEVECCYQTKYHLSEVANLINNLDTHKVELKTGEEFDKAYFGRSMPLEVLKLKLIGLEQGIKQTYNKLSNV